jgi:hypothetical protein
MAQNRVAIAVIHGMGNRGVSRPPINKVTFSTPLYHALVQKFGQDAFRTKIAWREVFWADLLYPSQQGYYDRAFGGRDFKHHKWNWARDYVIHNLGDPAAYFKSADQKAYVYKKIHERVAETITELESQAGEGTPLLIFAHSLGGHIMSNYIYDAQQYALRGKKAIVGFRSDFEMLKTFSGFLTFGCNIPVFTFGYKPEDLHPIAGPCAQAQAKIKTWWQNVNDRDDVLGMPLAAIGEHYNALAKRGELKDHWIDAGPWYSSWTPKAHNDYWADPDFVAIAEGMIQKALKIGRIGV